MYHHIDTTGEDAFRVRIASPAPADSLGPVDAAICGALERQALDNAQHAVSAATKGDRAYFRRAATAFSRALELYTDGVRPQLLQSGAYLLPSSSGQSAHIVHMDGDWMCSCKAGASMHWPIAMVIGLEVAHDAMDMYDDGDVEEVEIDPTPTPTPESAAAKLAERLEATARYVEALRAEQGRSALSFDPPGDCPLGSDEGDEPPARHLGVRLASARKRSAYFVSAFYLSAA